MKMRAPPVLFWTRYFVLNAVFAVQLLFRGQWRRVCHSLYARIYSKLHWLRFWFVAPLMRRRLRPAPEGKLQVVTEHPVAFKSPDHLAPFGTMYDNSTNRGFILLLNEIVRQKGFGVDGPAYMDLGCSGGQLVKDFIDLNWTAVGLEGSDYSLKHRRANWKTLAGKNLFTCDLTKPFQVQRNGQPLKFNLITAWEVMEHIHPNDLDQVFGNIRSHLAEGGYFIASTASYSSIQDGIELHQTRMTNSEWRKFIAQRYPDLQAVDLGLQIHQYVRYDFGEPSFLVYEKRSVKAV